MEKKKTEKIRYRDCREIFAKLKADWRRVPADCVCCKFHHCVVEREWELVQIPEEKGNFGKFCEVY
jgi:hypothetical protein